MIPKNVIAKNSRAAVGASLRSASMIMSDNPQPAPANSPKMVGTKISAATGVILFVMIRYMKAVIMEKPSMTSIASPQLCGVRHGIPYGMH